MRLYHPSAFDTSVTPDSHWQASAPPLGRALSPLSGSVKAEIAIIGAGYTGLHAAFRLAGRYGRQVVVLEAAEPGWGASGRNGGFCCAGSAKLSVSAMIRRFGLDATKAFHAAQQTAIDHVGGFLQDSGIEADRTEDGWIELAHRPNRVAGMREEQAFVARTFGKTLELLDRDGLAAAGASGPEFHGGLKGSAGFGLHPMKYVRGLARAALDAGVTIHSGSPVTAWRQETGSHILSTPHGELRADKVLLATNGYTDETVPDWIGGRLLPALSRIIVTRPLTPQELAAQGWTTQLVSHDTRNLLHYFRLLPCGRFLFGGRGGTDASPEGLARITESLRADFERMFPAWANVETERSWAGFVCLASGLTPYAGPIAGLGNAFAALAYHGNGVAMGSYAGRMMADVMSGARALENTVPEVMRAPLGQFPFPSLRLLYLKSAYLAFRIKDEHL